MAYDIGPRIGIEGEREFRSAITQINTNLKTLGTEMQAVSSRFEKGDQSMEALTAQNEVLNKQIDTQKQKLSELQKGLAAAADKYGENHRVTQGWQQAVNKATADLNNMERQLQSNTQSLSKLGASLHDTGEKMKGLGEKATIGVTAPIVAAGAVMLKGATEAQQAQGKLQASLGLTAEAAADLSAVAEATWANGFGGNIDEVNNAIISVRKNIGELAEDEMQDVTEAAMTIAEVFDQDVNEVTRAAGVAMKNWGISGQEAMDILTVGFQRGGDYSGELLDTIREYSPQFASLGLSAEQSMAMLIAGAEAGAWNLDKVGDAVKEFNIRAQDGSSTTAEGFAMIGLNAEEMGAAIANGGDEAQKAFVATITALANMDDPLKQNLAGVNLFGTQWEDVRSQVIVAMKDGVKGLGDFEGATKEASDAMRENNPMLALTQAAREMSLAIGPVLLPIATIISETIAPAIKSMAEGFASMSPAGQKVVLAIAGIVAAIGPLLVIFGQMAIGISGLIGLFGGGAAAGGLAAVLTAITGPVGIAIAAIAALVAAGVAVYKNWDGIVEFFSDVWEGIKNAIMTAANAVLDFLKEWGPLILAVITGPVGMLVYAIAKNWDEIKNTAIKIWNAIKDFVVDAFKWLYDHNYYFKDLVDSISEAWNNLKAVTEQLWNGLKSWLGSIWQGIAGTASTIWNGIKSTLSGILSAIGSVIQEAWNSVASATSTAWNRVSTIISGVGSSIKSTLSNLGSQAYQWGKNLLNEFGKGISDRISYLKDMAKRAVEQIARVLGFHSPAKEGPGRDADKWAPNFMDMFTEGIAKGIPNLQAAVTEAVSSLNGLEAVQVAAVAGETRTNQAAAGNYTFNFSGPISVRNDSDIRRVAQEIFYLERQALRGRS